MSFPLQLRVYEHSIGNSFDQCDPDKTFFINNLEFLSGRCITAAKIDEASRSRVAHWC